MKTELVTLKPWMKELTVEVAGEEMEPYRMQAVRAFQKRVQLNGFRKGKVPIEVLYQKFPEELKAEITEELVRIFSRRAMEEKDIRPVVPGKVKEIEFEEGKYLTFKVEVEVEPEISVSDYVGLKVEKPTWEVTEALVDRTIEDLRQQSAKLEVVKGEAKPGHILYGDIQALDISGFPLIGQKWENRILEPGASPEVDLLLEQLVGVRVGEQRRISLPQRVQDPQGKIREEIRQYVFTAKGIYERILPPVDHDFAQRVGKFESVEAMREGIRKWLEAKREAYSREEMVNRIIDQVIRRNDFELPPGLVELTFQWFWEDYQKENKEPEDADQIREKYLPAIVRYLKWRRIWNAIAQAEGFTVTDEDIQAEIDKAISERPQEEKRIRARYKDPERLESFRNTLLEEKVIQFLIDHAKIKEFKVDVS